MYNTTGFTRDEINDLCVMVRSAELEQGINHWPPILGLFKSLVVALTYMHRNRVQAELAETYGVSQPTISRAITGVTPLLGRALRNYVPTADELDERTQYIVDGTLLPCWSWAAHPELYSGKHKTAGMNVQVAYTITGRLTWISDPVNGSRHYSYCLSESEVLLTLDPGNWLGDKCYVGNEMIRRSRNHLAASSLTGRRNSTCKLTKSATSSSRSLRTSRPGGSCTPIIDGRRNVPRNYLSRYWPAFLYDRLNKPPDASRCLEGPGLAACAYQQREPGARKDGCGALPEFHPMKLATLKARYP